MKKEKSIWYYLSLLTIALGIIQTSVAFIEARKNFLLEKNGIEINGVVVDKNITERTEDIYTGYRLKFVDQSLNRIYQKRFFKSLNSSKNFGDTLTIIHYATDVDRSQLADKDERYSSMVVNFLIGILLLISGVLGVKKCVALGCFIRGD